MTKENKTEETKVDSVLKLNVYGRIKLGELFPQKAKLEEGIIVKDIRAKIAFTQDEITKFEIKTIITETGDSTTKWNQKGNNEKGFDLTELEITFLQKQVERLDSEAEIPTETPFIELVKQIKSLKG